MRVEFFLRHGQAVSLLLPLFLLSFFSGCRGSSEELPVMPPTTHPLTREYIGYGVVNGSFTQLLSDPGSGGVSRGYLRRGTVVRIIERRSVINRTRPESWVLVEGNYSAAFNSQEASGFQEASVSQGGHSPSQGWIQESMVEIFDNESRAKTASKAMNL